MAHCRNQSAAESLRGILQEMFPETDIKIAKCLGLCSYYAKKGGLLVGFEKF